MKGPKLYEAHLTIHPINVFFWKSLLDKKKNTKKTRNNGIKRRFYTKLLRCNCHYFRIILFCLWEDHFAVVWTVVVVILWLSAMSQWVCHLVVFCVVSVFLCGCLHFSEGVTSRLFALWRRHFACIVIDATVSLSLTLWVSALCGCHFVVTCLWEYHFWRCHFVVVFITTCHYVGILKVSLSCCLYSDLSVCGCLHFWRCHFMIVCIVKVVFVFNCHFVFHLHYSGCVSLWVNTYRLSFCSLCWECITLWLYALWRCYLEVVM